MPKIIRKPDRKIQQTNSLLLGKRVCNVNPITLITLTSVTRYRCFRRYDSSNSCRCILHKQPGLSVITVGKGRFEIAQESHYGTTGYKTVLQPS